MYEYNINTEQDPQKIAANPNLSVFLSASAGTGKTKVLCDRFLNLMLSGVEPEKILCITYTNSAAAEMLERITSLARFYAELDDDGIKQNLGTLNEVQIRHVKNLYKKILFGKYRLKVQTLHSFCFDVITRYRESYGNVSKKLIDPAIKKKALAQIFDKIATNFLELSPRISESFIELSKHCATSIIGSRILSLMSKTTNLKEYLARYLNDKELATHIFELNDTTEDFNYEQAKAKVFAEINSDFIHKLIEASRIENKILDTSNAIKANDYKALLVSLLTLNYTPRKLFSRTKLLKVDEQIVEEVENLQQSLISLEQQQRNYMFAKLNLCFIYLAREILEQYEAFKQGNHYIDYDDIISGAFDLMTCDPGILYNLDYKIDHILLDEAQDLSSKQWKLVEMMSQEFFAGLGAQEQNRTLFMVGDFKQSIFSFQGAAPEIFKSISKTFADKTNESNWKEVEMSKSFRSKSNILQLVNEIFPKFFDGFTNHQAHKEGDGHVEVWPLIDSEKKEKQAGWKLPQKDIDVYDKNYKLADFICSKITSWFESGRVLSGTMKAIGPSDIMILVRKRSDAIDILAAQLRNKGFDVVLPNYGRFIDDLVIMDIVSILEFLLNPGDDLNLAGLLKSPFFGLSEADLFTAAYQREGLLIDNLPYKFLHVSEELAKLRALFEKKSILAAFQEIFSEWGKRDNLVTRFGSHANISIDNFLEATHKFELLNTGMGIKSFLEYLEFYQIENTVEAQNQNAIRIMTVHSAKGLQSPIVILADAASSESNSSDDVFFHNEELYFSVGAHQKSKAFESAQEFIKQSDYAESLRLLYVAITRAESELYVAGTQSKNSKLNWYDIISEHVGDSLKSNCVFAPIKYTAEALNQNSEQTVQKNLKKELKYTLKSRDVLEGNIIHDFLEKLSIFENRYIDTYLRRQKHKFRSQFTEYEIDKFYNEAQEVVYKFPHIFGNKKNIINEQSFITDSLQFFRIDKIIIGENCIDIIDFKTDNTPPKTILTTRNEYIEQIGRYAEHIKNIFPRWKICGFLLWTKSKEMLKVIDL
jgi:ATP-dependent helicase/nuclease subunit A